MAAIDSVLTHCDASRDRHLDQLFTLLRQPSISTQGFGVEACAALVRDLLAASGFAATNLPDAGLTGRLWRADRRSRPAHAAGLRAL